MSMQIELASCALIACVTAAVIVQPQSAQQPTFRATTELVVVDLSAVDRDGVPVKDLTASDLTVTVDGQPRRIASLQFIDESKRPVRAVTAMPAVSSNTSGGGGRVVLIVVDEGSISFGGMRGTVTSLERLLAGFGPSDRVGLAALPGPRMLVNFGTDRQRIIEAAKRVTGAASPALVGAQRQISVNEAFAITRGDSQVLDAVVDRECSLRVGGSGAGGGGGGRGATGAGGDRQAGGAPAAAVTPPPPAAAALACRTEIEMLSRQIAIVARNQSEEFARGLRALLAGLRRIDAPKILVVLSEGLASPEPPPDLMGFGRDAAAARAVIYTMRVNKVTFDVSERRPSAPADDQRTELANLDTVARLSRGTGFDVIGSGESAFGRLARELSGYYLVGIEPEGSDRDGKPHRIQISTARTGVTVRGRPEFTFTPAAAASAANEAKLLSDTLASPAVVTNIPLRVTTVNLADDDADKVRVMVLAEIDRGQKQRGHAQVAFSIYDARGNVLTGSSQAVDLDPAPSGALAFTSVGVVPQGTYTLKLVAVREGLAGSVEHPFAARLTSVSTFRLGDLIVRNPVSGSGQTPAALALGPVISGDSLVGYVNMRAERAAPLDAAFSLEIVKEQDGQALISVPMATGQSSTATGRRETSVPGLRTMAATVDARLLPPGDYGARLTVSVGGQPSGSVYTEFSIAPAARGTAAHASSSTGASVSRFQLADVMAPASLAPLLDDLMTGATPDAAAALAKAKEGRLAEAAQLEAAAPGDPRPAFLRGLQLLSAGKLDDAANAFREATRANPEFLMGAFFIGTCYAAGGKEEQAINAWQTSLVSMDRFPLVYRVLTDALMRARQLERATALLEEAVERWPDDQVLAVRLMRATFDAGRYDGVCNQLDRLTSRGLVEPPALLLGMQAIFLSVRERDEASAEMLARLGRYRDLYAAAGGTQQPLVAEWVAFVRRNVK